MQLARSIYQKNLQEIKDAGTWKNERIITTPMTSQIGVQGTAEKVIVMCSNGYLGLSDNKEVIEASKEAMDKYGFGLSSVRFICGTQDLHKKLEGAISTFFGTDDTILYSSCFDANGGLFEVLLGEEDCILSDALNHASIIDGVRLCKAKRARYEHMNLQDLEQKLKDNMSCRLRLISTDGVFSMDGDIAPLKEICDLAEKYNALVHVDDSHATGFMGRTGRGSCEHCGVLNRVDVITSTLGKALGGASGGFTTGRREIIDLLRQRSRPYLFSNTVAPAICGASLKVIEMLSRNTALRDRLEEHTAYFRQRMTQAGFNIRPGVHPIVPIMLFEARLASEFADELLKRGVYAIGFSYPVVPKGQARIRVQISACHTRELLDRAIAAFIEVGKLKGVIPN